MDGPDTLAETLDLSDWPARERRRPRRTERDYLVLSALAHEIVGAVERHLSGRRDLRVLDVGCGDKPYLPLVAHRAVSWRGLDYDPGPLVDDLGAADALPYADGSFDLVLCTQVLEHLPEPQAAVAEMHRVLAPGGVALASTHGVHVYHPDPPGSGQDFWRWTHSGLERLFATHGDWASLEIRPNRNLVACLAAIVVWYVDGLLRLMPARRAGGPLLAAVNGVAEWLDDRFPKTLRVPAPGSLSANYLVVARR